MKIVLQLSVLSFIISGGCLSQSNRVNFVTEELDGIYYYNRLTRFAFVTLVNENTRPTAFADIPMNEIFVYNEANYKYVKVNGNNLGNKNRDALRTELLDKLNANKYKQSSTMDSEPNLIIVRGYTLTYRHTCPTAGKLIVLLFLKMV